VNYQPRLPQCKANRLGLPQIAILLEDEFETRTYASLFRCVEFAPIEKRLQIFHLAARFAAGQIALRRQRAIDGLQLVAEESGLVRLLGVPAVQDVLTLAFGGVST
jgi:hypothetical protein